MSMEYPSYIKSAIAVLSDAKSLLRSEPRIRGMHYNHSLGATNEGTVVPENLDDEILFNYEAILRMNDDVINKAQENANRIEQLSRSYKIYSDMKAKADQIDSKIDALDNIQETDLHEKYGLRRSNLVYNSMLNRGSPSKGRIRGSYSPSPVHSTPHESSNSGGGGGDHAAVSDDDDQKGGGDEDIDVGSTYVGLRSLEDEIERARVMHALKHYLGAFQVQKIRSELEAADVELSGQERIFGDVVSKSIDWFDSSEVQEMVKSDTAEKALPPSDAATERKNRNLLKGLENGIKKSYAAWKRQAHRKLESARVETAAAFKHVRSRILAIETETALLLARRSELDRQIEENSLNDDAIRSEVEEAFLPAHIEMHRKIEDVKNEYIEIDKLRSKYREEIARTNELRGLILGSATSMTVYERNKLVEEHLGKSLDEDLILLNQLQAQLEERKAGIATLAAQYAESQAVLENEETQRRRSTILNGNKLRRQEVSASVELATAVRKLQGVKDELDMKLQALERRADMHLRALGFRDHLQADVLTDLKRTRVMDEKSAGTDPPPSDAATEGSQTPAPPRGAASKKGRPKPKHMQTRLDTRPRDSAYGSGDAEARTTRDSAASEGHLVGLLRHSRPDDEDIATGIDAFKDTRDLCGPIQSVPATAAYIYFLSYANGVGLDESTELGDSVIELPIREVNDIERLAGVGISVHPFVPSCTIMENISVMAVIASKLHDIGYLGPRSYNLMTHVLVHPVYSILRYGIPGKQMEASDNQYDSSKDRLIRKPYRFSQTLASDVRSQLSDFYNRLENDASSDENLRIDLRRVCISLIEYVFTAFPQVIEREMHRPIDPDKIELCIWRRITEVSPELFAFYSILIQTSPYRSFSSRSNETDEDSSKINRHGTSTDSEYPVLHLKESMRRSLHQASLHLTGALMLSYQHNLDSIAEFSSINDTMAPESPLTYQMSFMHKCGLLVNLHRAATMCSWIDEDTKNPFYTSLVDWITKHFVHDWSALSANSRLLDDTCVLRAYLAFFYYVSLRDDLPDVARGILDFDKELEYLLEVTRVSVLNVNGVLEASSIEDPFTYVGMFSDGIPLSFLLRHVIPEAIPILIIIKLLLRVTAVTCHSKDTAESPKGRESLGRNRAESIGETSAKPTPTQSPGSSSPSSRRSNQVQKQSQKSKNKPFAQQPTKLSDVVELAGMSLVHKDQSEIARKLARTSYTVYVYIDNLLNNMLGPSWDASDQRSACLSVLQIPEPLLKIIRLYASELLHIGAASIEAPLRDFVAVAIRLRSIIRGISTIAPILKKYREYYDALVTKKSQEVHLVNAVFSFRKLTISVCEALLERCDYNSAKNELQSEFAKLSIASANIAEYIHKLRGHVKTLKSMQFSDPDARAAAIQDGAIRQDVARAIQEVSKHMASLSGFKEGGSTTSALASIDIDEATRAKLGTRSVTDSDLARLRDQLLEQNTTMRLEVQHWSSEWTALVREISEATEQINRK